MTTYSSSYRLSSPPYGIEDTGSQYRYPLAQAQFVEADLDTVVDDSGYADVTVHDADGHHGDAVIQNSNMSFEFEDYLPYAHHQGLFDKTAAHHDKMTTHQGAILVRRDTHEDTYPNVIADAELSELAAVVKMRGSETDAAALQESNHPLEVAIPSTKKRGKGRNNLREKKPTLDDLVPYPNPLHEQRLEKNATQEEIDACREQRGTAHTERDPNSPAGQKRMRCSWCKDSFRDRNGCNRHVLGHNLPEGVKCHACGDPFKRSDKFANHIRSKHRLMPRMDFKTEYVQLFTGTGITEQAMLFLRGEKFTRQGSKKGPVSDRVLTRNCSEYNRSRTVKKTEKRRAKKAAELVAQGLDPESFPKLKVARRKPGSQIKKATSTRPTISRKVPRDFSKMIPTTTVIPENDSTAIGMSPGASLSSEIGATQGQLGVERTPIRRSTRTKTPKVPAGQENASGVKVACYQPKKEILKSRYASRAPRKSVYGTSKLLSHLAGKGEEIQAQGLAMIAEVSIGHGLASDVNTQSTTALGLKYGSANQMMPAPRSYLQPKELNQFW